MIAAAAAAAETPTHRRQSDSVDTFANPCYDDNTLEDSNVVAEKQGDADCVAAIGKSTPPQKVSCSVRAHTAGRIRASDTRPPQATKLPATACFEGDISTWNHQRRESGSSDGDGSLSSGLSPREGAVVRKPWDGDAGLTELAYEAERYGRAAAAAAVGRADAGHLASSDLATRLAAQQLGTLAGMSVKVQEALVHSQHAFRIRLAHSDRIALHAAWSAWIRRRDTAAAVKRLEARAARHLQHRRQLHLWRAWHSRVADPDVWTRRQRQAIAVLARHKQLRMLIAWSSVCAARAEALQLTMRDREILSLSQEVRKYELVPIRALARFRQRHQLRVWMDTASCRRAKQKAFADAARHHARHMSHHTMSQWCQVACEARQAAERQRAAVATLLRKRTRRLLLAWARMPALAAGKRHSTRIAVGLAARVSRGSLVQAWTSLIWYTAHSRAKRQATAMTHTRPMRLVLHGWCAAAAQCRQQTAGIRQCQLGHSKRLLKSALAGWVSATDESAEEVALASAAEVRQRLAAAEGEGARLAAENRRFARLIDNPDWDPKAQAEERAAAAAKIAALEAEVAALKEASQGANQEAATALALLPARRRTAVEAAVRSSAALSRLAAARRASREKNMAVLSQRPAHPKPVASNKLAPYSRAPQPIKPQSLPGFVPMTSAMMEGGQGIIGHRVELSSRPQSPAGGSRPGSSAGRIVHHHHVDADARNRMLIQGGSSFNALVKALRQQASDSEGEGNSPRTQRHPNGFESNRRFDKLSMNSVEVFPDGSLTVEALPAHRFPHASKFTTKSSSLHVAFGMSSPQPSLRKGPKSTGNVASSLRPVGPSSKAVVEVSAVDVAESDTVAEVQQADDHQQQSHADDSSVASMGSLKEQASGVSIGSEPYG